MKFYSALKQTAFFFIIIAVLGSSEGLYAGDNFKLKLRDISAEKRLAKKKLIGIDLDIQVGVSISKTNFETTVPNDTLDNTTSKTGPLIGALLSVNFFGLGFTSGLQYSAKGYETTTGGKSKYEFFQYPVIVLF